MSFQVLLPFPSNPVDVAGLPHIFRTTQQAAELHPVKILWTGAPQGFARRWSRQLASFERVPVLCAPGEAFAPHLNPGLPLLLVSGEGIPRPEPLKTFLEKAASSSSAARWVFSGKTVACYWPKPPQALLEQDLPVMPAQAGDWHDAARDGFIVEAERALYAGLGKDNDGFIAHWDRKLSGALSRLLLKTSVTPNQITTASLLTGLLGSALIATGAYGWQVAGALLLWSCCILDGCDGEVARLKLLCSKAGATYDVAADNFAHLAAFFGIAVGVHRSRPDLAVFWPGLVLLAGVAASMFSVWWLILRRPDERRSSLELFVERVASRDYVYLVLALALLDKLHWFLWAAAAGSHLFNAGLWVFRDPRSAGRPPLPPAHAPS